MIGSLRSRNVAFHLGRLDVEKLSYATFLKLSLFALCDLWPFSVDIFLLEDFEHAGLVDVKFPGQLCGGNARSVQSQSDRLSNLSWRYFYGLAALSMHSVRWTTFLPSAMMQYTLSWTRPAKAVWRIGQLSLTSALSWGCPLLPPGKLCPLLWACVILQMRSWFNQMLCFSLCWMHWMRPFVLIHLLCLLNLAAVDEVWSGKCREVYTLI